MFENMNDETQPSADSIDSIEIQYFNSGGDEINLKFTRRDLYCLDDVGYILFESLCKSLIQDTFESYDDLYQRYISDCGNIHNHAWNGNYLRASKTMEKLLYPIFEYAIDRLLQLNTGNEAA